MELLAARLFQLVELQDLDPHFGARRRLLPASRTGQSTENVQLRADSFSPARLVKPPSDSLFSSNR